MLLPRERASKRDAILPDCLGEHADELAAKIDGALRRDGVAFSRLLVALDYKRYVESNFGQPQGVSSRITLAAGLRRQTGGKRFYRGARKNLQNHSGACESALRWLAERCDHKTGKKVGLQSTIIR